MKKEIKLIIFDLWDTIAYHKFKQGSLKNICTLCYKKDYRSFLKSYEKNLQKSKTISYEKGFKKLFNELHINYEDEILRKHIIKKRKKYEETFKFYSYIEHLIKKLKKQGYKIALLSNTSFFLGSRIKKTKIGKLFDKLFFSYELKAIKPNPKTFKTVIKHFKVKPEETIMIGDTYLDDVVAAKKLKMNAIHFKNPDQLKKDLKKMLKW